MQKEAKLGLVVVALILALIVGLYFLVPQPTKGTSNSGESKSGVATLTPPSSSGTSVPPSTGSGNDPLLSANPAGSTLPPTTPTSPFSPTLASTTQPSDPLSVSVGPTIVPPATTQRSTGTAPDVLGGGATPPVVTPPSTSFTPGSTPPSVPGEDPWRSKLGVGPGSSSGSYSSGSGTNPPSTGVPGSNLPPFPSRTSTTSDPASASTSSYTVVKGDTLSAISSKVYGNPNLWAKIAAANPGVDSSRLKIGQVLKIPAKTDVAPDASASSSAPAVSHDHVSGSALVKDPRSEYQVVSGDSLHKIAQKLYGNANRWEEIYNLNKALIGPSPTRLKIGMVLKLPAPPTSPKPGASSSASTRP